MCGICGIFNYDRRHAVARETLRAVNDTIFHRGPDDEGLYVSENVGLAMRRLSIIDLQTGKQPVTNEDETIFVVYNGEIYNHIELRAQLEALGHRFYTHTDTETIVHLYEQYGRECVQHLRGMFAFVLWDSRRRVLFGARDRFGIKPFYYLHTAERFLFASEIKALLACPGVRGQLNYESVPEYLAFGYLSGEETFFQGIKKLPPGHTVEVNEAGEVRIERYWDLKASQPSESRSFDSYAQEYGERLEQTVSDHLMSDVPLGVFLSGGLDSSAIAALMTRIRRAPIETFSVGYSETPYSELEYARAVATHINSVHHEVVVGREQFFESLPTVIWHEDEPLAWPCSVALYHVARLAREHVTVVLTGEGSDETLAGYLRYPWTVWNARADRLYRALTPAQFRNQIRSTVATSNLLGATLRKKIEHSCLARDGQQWTDFYFDNFFSAFTQNQQRSLLKNPSEFHDSPYRNNMRIWDRSSGDLLKRMLYTDIHTFLQEGNMMQDNVSMAASLEARVPFLDHALVEFAFSIPSHFHTQGLSGKRILKHLVAPLLPSIVLHRKKLGFPTPWEFWLSGAKSEAIEKLLLHPRTTERGLVRPEAVQRLFAEHRAGYRDHATRIWRLLNLELWDRVFLEGDRAGLEECATAVVS
jgi:asparagine synthase (glutamine-hydrolysing)